MAKICKKNGPCFETYERIWLNEVKPVLFWMNKFEEIWLILEIN